MSCSTIVLARGQIAIHRSDVQRTATLAAHAADTGELVIAERREQVATLNAAIRDQHAPLDEGEVTTSSGERIGVGDVVATRRNDTDLGVTNRQQWTVTEIDAEGSMTRG